MTKFTKLSAAALFALFLTACDKPTEKMAEPAKEEAKQTMDAPKTEVAPVATEAPKTAEMNAEMPVDAQGVADFKKLLDWNQAQEAMLAQAQADLQESITSQDKAKIEQAFTAFKGKVDGVLKGLDSLEIKNQEVNAFKTKTKESLMLSSDLISESVKAMSSQPTPELQAAIQEKAQKLILLGAELQKDQAELQSKFTK